MEGFTTFMYLEHCHYRCVDCGKEFCGKDTEWAYHDCKEEADGDL